MRITLIIYILFFYGNAVYCQLDTTNLYKTLKLHVLIDQNNGVIDISGLCDLTDISVIKLKSKGFERVDFFAIEHRMILGKENQDSVIDKNNLTPFDCFYIIAYNIVQDKIYHLKGFRDNDFKDFYIYEISNYLKTENKPAGKILTKSGLQEDFEVEDLDLECLYLNFIKRKKPQKNSCLISCKERDINLF